MKYAQTRAVAHAFTAAAVVVALGLPPGFVFACICAESVSVDTLRAQLLTIRDQSTAIERRAAAEGRELSEAEQDEISRLFSDFEVVEAKLSHAQGAPGVRARKTNADLVDTDEPRAAVGRMPAQARSMDAGKSGFKSMGDYLKAVMAGSQTNARPDPRLFENSSPTSYGSEGVGADGGFAVPPDFRTQIMQKVMGEQSLLSLTDQQTSSSNSISFPADETTPWQSGGGIQAYWESEGGLKTQSKPTLVEKTVKLNKIIALVPLTDELLEDAPAMAGYVQRKAPTKIQFRINDAIINGTGVGQPLGILSSPGTVVVAKEALQVTGSVMFNNITKLWSAVHPSQRLGARWLMHPDVEPTLMSLAFPVSGATAVPAYMPPNGLAAAPFGTLLGKPLFFSEAMQPLGSQGDIVFGDLSNYLSVTKAGGVRSDVSIHIWFDYDITAFRFVLRVGGQPWWNAPILPFQQGATSRGFFATLASRP